jgi:hypothetical protein
MMGMFATVAFYMVIGYCVTALPIAAAYLLAIVAAVSVNGVGLRLTR